MASFYAENNSKTLKIPFDIGNALILEKNRNILDWVANEVAGKN